MFLKFAAKLFTILFLPLVACQLPGGQVVQPIQQVSETTDLHFETLVKDHNAKLYDERDDYHHATYLSLDLFIALNIEEAQGVAGVLNPDMANLHLADIDEVDFAKKFVIVAYYGRAPNGSYAIAIEKIQQSDNLVDVFVSTMEPSGGDTGVTRPIHIVTSDKENLINRGELTFRMWKDNEIVVQHNHFVP